VRGVHNKLLMNYQPITFELLSERYEEIPERFRELLESDGTKALLTRIGAQHALDHDRQSALYQLFAMVFLGFLAPADFASELNDKVGLNFVHARTLAREVDEHLFAPYRRELALVYNPVGGAINETETVRGAARPPLAAPDRSQRRVISLESISAPPETVRAIPITTSPESPPGKFAPLVIVGSNAPSPARGPATRPPRISFLLPFKKPVTSPTPHTATIEMPGGSTHDTKTVDYSDTRPGTQTIPFASHASVNLDTLTPPAPPPYKPQPKLEGNTVDLRHE
jgi:hypothetical protein